MNTAKLTQPYEVFLARYNADVTLPVGTEFEFLSQGRNGDYIGLYQHPKYGELAVITEHAEKVR